MFVNQVIVMLSRIPSRVRRFVPAWRRSPLAELVDEVFGEVLNYSASHQFEDDVCLVGLEV